MTNLYLEVTYKGGKPWAAYLYLARRPGDTSARTERREGGMLIDYAADGRAIGIEFTSPSKVTLTAVNAILAQVRHDPATAEDLAPLPLAG